MSVLCRITNNCVEAVSVVDSKYKYNLLQCAGVVSSDDSRQVPTTVQEKYMLTTVSVWLLLDSK